jgi:hypothetical protein
MAHGPGSPGTSKKSRLPWRGAASWTLLALAIAACFACITYPRIPPSSDVWDYAQEARQLARGDGFTSLYTYPTHLGTEPPPFPVRWRMPLYAAIGAAFLAVGVPLPLGYFFVAVLAHAALVGLVFLLGSHLHSPRAGALAAAFAIASPILLDPFSAGLSQVPTAALGAAIWLLLLRYARPSSAAAAGLLATAAWYLRGETVIMVPLWFVCAARGRRWDRAFAFALIFAALSLPWIAHLRAETGAAAPIRGNPMLLYTPEYPGYSSTRTYLEPMPGVIVYIAAHPVTFAWRFAKDAVGYGIDLLWGLGPIALGLAMAGLLLRDPKERWRALRPAWWLLAAAAIQIAAFSCLERSPRFLVPALPLVCVALGLAAAPALDRICGRRNQTVLIALLILERIVLLGITTRDAERRFPPLPASTAVQLRDALGPPHGGIVWTDVPDWVAWRLDRPALLLPLWRQRDRVAADHPVAAIYLSPGARSRNEADGEAQWTRAADGLDSIPGFSRPEALSAGGQVFLPSY